MKEEKLTTFWLTFPKDDHLPQGIGVTAYNEEDVYILLNEQGWLWHEEAQEVCIKHNIQINELDQNHVVNNMGPMQFRGVWYPCGNLGFGSPKENAYVKLKK